MHSESEAASDLERLARRHGVLQEYYDIWGNPHRPSPQTCRAILRSMGIDVESEQRDGGSGELAVALGEPFVTFSDHAKQAFTLRMPPSSGPVHVSARCGAEVVGAAIEASVGPSEGEGSLRPVRVRLDPPLPEGIHDLTLEIRSEGFQESVRVRVAVAPDRGYDPLGENRIWGVNLALYGLRSDRNLGIGDFEDLRAVLTWAADLGASFVGLLPLHSVFNETPYGVSPYYPSSRIFLNPLYIALDRLPEASAPEVQAFLAASRGEVERLRAGELVDYPAAWALKRRALAACHREFQKLSPADSRSSAFRAWRRRRGTLLQSYCTFCALRDYLVGEDGHPRRWQEWPPEFQRPDARGIGPFQKGHEEAMEFHAYSQWLAETQLQDATELAQAKGMPLGIYLDLALGVDPSGADAWIFQDVLARGTSAGAPPDPFSLLGQRWGVPPPIPGRHRRDGYRFFVDTLRHNARRGGALRIDHAMALWRLFWIPDELPASQGAYVVERPEELLALLRLVSVEERCLIVGEDLGTVPPEVREDLRASGFYVYRLLIFEKEDGEGYRPPEQYPEQALVSATTHDLPTLDGFWTGRDLEVKRSLRRYPDRDSELRDAAERREDRIRLLEALAREGCLPHGMAPSPEVPEERLDDLAVAAHAFLARTPSRLLLANLDDLIGEREMQNLPGTLDEHPNWRRKCRVSVEVLPSCDRARLIAEAIGREGRRRVVDGRPQPSLPGE